MTDWKQVAETLRMEATYASFPQDYDAAIRLCQLAAKLPAGEAEQRLQHICKHENTRWHDASRTRLDCLDCGATIGGA